MGDWIDRTEVPMAIGGPTRLSLVVLRCDHIEESRVFYAALGLSLVPEQHGGGPAHFAAELPSGFVLELYPRRPGEPVDRSTQVGLVVDDLAEVLAELKLLAVEIRSASETSAVALDPDGRTIRISSP